MTEDSHTTALENYQKIMARTVHYVDNPDDPQRDRIRTALAMGVRAAASEAVEQLKQAQYDLLLCDSSAERLRALDRRYVCVKVLRGLAECAADALPTSEEVYARDHVRWGDASELLPVADRVNDFLIGWGPVYGGEALLTAEDGSELRREDLAALVRYVSEYVGD